MPFDILSGFSAVEVPSAVELTSSGIGGVTVAVVPNLDAAGGGLTVTETTAAIDGVPGTATLQYTDFAGTVSDITIDLPEGYSVAAGEGVVFGDGLDEFLVAGNRVGTLETGEAGTAVTMLKVGIDDDGAPVALGFDNSVRPELYDETRDVNETLELYPLGDGRVGFALPATRDDWGIQYGTVSDEEGETEATFLGGGVLVSGHAIALDDGGLLYLEQEPGGPGDIQITQLDANGLEIASHLFRPDIDLADVGFPDQEGITATVLINDTGELELFATIPETEPSETFRIEYDLLPEQDVGIEIFAGADDDTLEGTDGADLLSGGAGNDVVYGGVGFDDLRGEAGADTLYGGFGKDDMRGGDGDDALYGGAWHDTMHGNQGNDEMYGGNGKDDVRGGDGDDVMYGGGWHDTMRGDRGNDEMYGGNSNDDMNGGLGDDLLYGDAGNDTVSGFDGNDSLFGGDGDDLMRGGRGDDSMTGDAGNDIVFGGAGADNISGHANYDTIFGGAGNDSIFGDGGFDDLRGGAGADTLYGGLGKDDVRGGDDNDVLYGGGWHDFMRGNQGNDEMYGGNSNDNMNGGVGDDLVSGDAGNDKMSGYKGNDSLYGGDGEDAMHGGRGDDIMNGGAGNDVLRGAHGADTLSGDAGDDLLIGGKGADVYAFDLFGDQSVESDASGNDGPDGAASSIEDPVSNDNGTDTIKGFTIGDDKIALDGSYLVADSSATPTSATDLTFDDIFLSQEDSFAIIEAGDTTIRLQGVNVDDLSEDDFILT